MENEKQISRKEQIMWYIGRIVDRLTDTQVQAVLAMLKKFYGKLKREG